MKNKISNQDYVIFLQGQSVVIGQLEKWRIQQVSSLDHFFNNLLAQSEFIFIGELEGRQCYTALISVDVDEELLVNARSLMHQIDELEWFLLARAMQISSWKRQHQFCGQCGQATQESTTELATICHPCNIYNYPRISPCIMVLIVRGDECLLAHHHKFPEPRYSTLAGFVEAGESLEATLHREVMEEVGLKVNNLRYFSSQSWPFPHQLMACFIADYESGDIKIDDDEIADAQWFRYDQLPLIPPLTTISGKVIEAFVKMKIEQNA